MQAWSPVPDTQKASGLLVWHQVATYLLSTHYVAGTEKKAASGAEGLPSGCLGSRRRESRLCCDLGQVPPFPGLSVLICEMKTMIPSPAGEDADRM